MKQQVLAEVQSLASRFTVTRTRTGDVVVVKTVDGVETLRESFTPSEWRALMLAGEQVRT